MGPRDRFYPYLYHCDYIGLLFHLGRAPRTKETLPDFLKWRRVTRHPLVFRGLTGSQRTPGFGASHAHTPNMLMSLRICNANITANFHVICMMHNTWNILINGTLCQVPCNIYRKHISSLHFMSLFIDIVVSCILAFINT